MVVNRRTFIPKRGCLDQLVELYKAERERTGAPVRILTCEYGPFDVFVMEIEAENKDAYFKLLADFSKDPAGEAFFDKHMALTENGGTNEIWTVH